MKKTRTGHWVVASVTALAIGAIAVSQGQGASNPDTTVSNSNKDSEITRSSNAVKDAVKSKTNDSTSSKSNTEKVSEAVTNAAKKVAETASNKDEGKSASIASVEQVAGVVAGNPAQTAAMNAVDVKPTESATATMPSAKTEPLQPKTTTKVISQETKAKPLPQPEINQGGGVVNQNTNKTSDKEIAGEKPSTPADQGQTNGGTSSQVTPGQTNVVKPEVPAKPGKPAIPEIKDDKGNIVTPGKPAEPETPAQPAETTRTDVLTETTVINFGRKFVKDTTLAPGETRVITQGVNGSRVVKTQITYKNNVEVGRQVIEDTTTPAIDEVVAYNDEAPKNREIVEETITETQHGVERRATTELKEGQERVITKGVNGKTKTTTRKVLDANGNVLSQEVVSTETIQEPVTEIIEYGVAKEDKVEVLEERTTEVLPYKTQTRENKDLARGEKRVITKGVNGSVEHVATITKTNGVETDRKVRDENRVEPTDEIVEVGTKDVVTTKRDVKHEVLNFKTIRRENKDLYEGETRVVTKGVNGSVDHVTTTTFTNGVETNKTTNDENRVEPTDEVVEYGTKPKAVVKERTEREEIPYQTVTKSSDTLKKGETRVVTKGKAGYRIVKITTTTINGQTITNREVIETVPATNEVVEVGTKEDIRQEIRVEREELQYKTITRQTDELFEGETRVVSQGKNGTRATTYKDTYVDGVKTKTEVVGEPVEIPAEDRIVEVGTKKEITTESVINEETVNFKTKTEYDDTLDEGQTRIRVNGVNGSRKVKVTRTTNNRTGEVTTKTEVLYETPAIDEVVVIGTKKKPVVPSQPDKISVEDFMKMSESEQDAFLAKNPHGVTGDSVYYDDVDQAKLNRMEKITNLKKLNEEFIKLVNADRIAKGLDPVEYAGEDSEVQQAATTRANEMADYGSLRHNGVVEGAHKRPDGSDWTTIYTPEQTEKMRRRAENALQFGASLEAEDLANEKKMAQDMFELWKASRGHYRNMMLPGKYKLALGFGSGARTYNNQSNKDWGITVGMMEMVQYWN